MRSPTICVLVALVVVGGCHSGNTTDTPQPGCGYQVWSEPREIHGITEDPAVLQFASIAAGRNGGYVAGNGVVLVERPVTGTLVLATLDGQILPRPPGSAEFYSGFPQAAVDQQERLHLVWGEPPEGEDAATYGFWGPEWVFRLFYAIYDPQSGWSRPREVYTNDRNLLWFPQQSSLQLDATGRPHLAVLRPMFERSLVYLVLDDGGQDFSTVVKTPIGFYSAHTIDNDRIHIAMNAAADPTAEHPRPARAVYYMQSSDSGRHWTEPQLMPSSDNGGHAKEVQVVVTPDRAVHVIWSHDPEDGEKEIRHAVSRDRGATWGPTETLELGRSFTNLRAVVGTCGAIHLAFNPWVARHFTEKTFGYAFWLDNQWSGPHTLFPTLRPSYVQMTQGPEGKLYMLAPARMQGDSREVLPTPRISITIPRQ